MANCVICERHFIMCNPIDCNQTGTEGERGSGESGEWEEWRGEQDAENCKELA